jgi:hypothetical protein
MTMADIITEFEINEQVRVPAGDGKPEQWKRMGDLTVNEFGRYALGRKAEADQQMARTQRYAALVEEADRQALSTEELEDLVALKRLLDAQEKAQDRRQAAIDRDIEAGRFLRMLGEGRA